LQLFTPGQSLSHLPPHTVVGISYANDIRIASLYHDLLQPLDILLSLFARIGLLPNVEKTKAMICLGHRHFQSFTSATYKCLYDMRLPSHISRKRQKVNCLHCYKALNKQYYMPTHFCHIHHMTFYSSMNVDQTDSAPLPYKHHCVQHIPSHYEVNFLDKIIVCPVSDCPAWTTNTIQTLYEIICVFDIHLMASNLLESNSKDVNSVVYI
jgi:DNA phosphorothioation-dependent restriction protein DptG